MPPGVSRSRARSWSSPTTMSPLALVRPRHSPRDGAWQNRSPSTPGLGSSVTSKRSIGHARRAPASAPALPAGPDHVHSVRSRPGAAGCAVHSSDTRVPSTPDIAHSTCGHTAVGDEWTKITPRVLTADLRCRRGTSSPTSSRHGGPLEPATVRIVAVGRRCGDQSARPLAPRQLGSARRMRWACRIQVHAAGCCQEASTRQSAITTRRSTNAAYRSGFDPEDTITGYGRAGAAATTAAAAPRAPDPRNRLTAPNGPGRNPRCRLPRRLGRPGLSRQLCLPPLARRGDLLPRARDEVPPHHDLLGRTGSPPRSRSRLGVSARSRSVDRPVPR